MGLMDQLLGAMGGQGGGGKADGGSLVDMAAGMIQGQPGGLSGLLDRFRGAGLGQQADSWVSTGQNMPLTADQVSGTLGHSTVQNASQRLGLPPGAAAAALAMILPMVIDHLTPKGHVENTGAGAGAGDLSGMLAGLKSQFMNQA